MDRAIETITTVSLKPLLLGSFFMGFALGLVGCTGSRDGSSSDGSSDYAEEIRKHEASFDPSAYNPDLKAVLKEELEKAAARKETPVEVTNPGVPELVSGFRVQVLASSNIDEASRQKEMVEEIFPEEWFYIVYDPPTYKLRAGNFTTRFEADKFLKQLLESGFRDAWIVPDRVYKDPPLKNLESPDTPKQK